MFESAMKGRITAQKYLIEKFEQAQLLKESVQFYLEKWGTCLDDDPESVPMEVVRLMRTILDSRGATVLNDPDPQERKSKTELGMSQ